MLYKECSCLLFLFLTVYNVSDAVTASCETRHSTLESSPGWLAGVQYSYGCPRIKHENTPEGNLRFRLDEDQ